jgi:hypothetical protein
LNVNARLFREMLQTMRLQIFEMIFHQIRRQTFAFAVR